MTNIGVPVERALDAIEADLGRIGTMDRRPAILLSVDLTSQLKAVRNTINENPELESLRPRVRDAMKRLIIDGFRLAEPGSVDEINETIDVG